MRPGGFPKTHIIIIAALGLAAVLALLVAGERDDGPREPVATQTLPLDLPGAAAADSAAATVQVATSRAADAPPAAAALGAPSHPNSASQVPTTISSDSTQAVTPETPTTASATLPATPAGAAAPVTHSAAPATSVDPATGAPGLAMRERHAQVKPGDNLSKIFKREGIAARELALVLASKPLGPRLKSIFPGHDFVFALAEDDSLVKLTYTPGPLETLEFERAGDSFIGREVVREPERTTAYKHAVIDHSLFVASQRAGLDDAMTMRLAQIFQWDVDFVLDIRKGDEFYVLYEELYVGDEFVGYGDILAAEFINQGQSYRAVLYQGTDGDSNYFDPDGNSMRKAFLRAPVSFSRISSNFNLRRVHPLFKRTMPHRGIDYAAPSGTPILAAGDGRVLTASRTEANGNYVVLQHGEQFTTKYLHMSKFGRGIKSGVRVKQGQVIGYVGATGWATAPHLHYEFLVNGVHKNPRTVPLPKASPVPKQEFERFAGRAEPLLALLADYKQQIQLAMVH
ncbi:MAG: peptidoglycan DD-metalloendopeptidase family protein [Pseudomonadales bacterium]